MNHPAELALHKYMDDAANNKSTISEEVIQQIGNDIMDALRRQFGEKEPKKFSLRMSNVGKPTCQLWFEKNKPEAAQPKSNNFVMNMMLGDIVEAVFKGLLKEAGVKYEDTEKVSLDCGDTTINGSYDIVINNAVDDIKSASDWSYRNKFDSFGSLASGDAFGYVGQLAGYSKASDKAAGGWWVINKSNGKFKYVPATGIDVEKEVDKIKETIKTVEENKFERCFEAEAETFRKVETGNKILNKYCTFCDFKKTCWPNLIERPQVKSQAKFPKTVAYVELREEYMNG
tara:strand:- start:747 stop:1607 length:861 start_codon:yes stop_codon:yes gene_type:complete